MRREKERERERESARARAREVREFLRSKECQSREIHIYSCIMLLAVAKGLVCLSTFKVQRHPT
jgi:hypothetical protein